MGLTVADWGFGLRIFLLLEVSNFGTLATRTELTRPTNFAQVIICLRFLTSIPNTVIDAGLRFTTFWAFMPTDFQPEVKRIRWKLADYCFDGWPLVSGPDPIAFARDSI